MAAQQHKVMRQVIESRGGRAVDAERIRSGLRDAYFAQLLPLIDKVCSELGSPTRVHRIDRLELELGRVPLDGIGPALAARFEARLRSALAAAIGNAPAVDADLELFTEFIASGSVPWWADAADRRLLETGLARLLEQSPAALLRALRDTADPGQAWPRIVRAYPEALLVRLAALLRVNLPAGPGQPALADAAAPGDLAGKVTAWAAALAALPAARGHGAPRLRLALWELLLGGAETATPDAFDSLLRGLPGRLGITAAPFVAQGRAATAAAAAAAAAPAAAAAAAAPATAPPRGASGVTGTARADGKVEAETPAGGAGQLESGSAATAPADAAAGGPPPRTPHGAHPAPRAAPRRAPALRPRAAPELHLGNAGLVLLWPFLTPFFTRLGLLAGRSFVDPAGRHRAAGLLQYVAAADPEPPEPLLPLNKVLSGLAPDEVFDFGLPMTPVEIDECESLLAAVIARATILGAMSLDGFRGSFLLRQGRLAAAEGAWLLNVERATHDIVLDRFPWRFGIVKLPWMPAPLQVDW